MISDLVERVSTGVIDIKFIVDGQAVSSGTGFMANGYLVTNHHVFLGPHDSFVRLSWQDSRATNLISGIDCHHFAFKNYIVDGSAEDDKDFAILDIPELREQGLYQFTLAAPTECRIGDPIVLMGYPFGDIYFTCHAGIISTLKESNGVDVIQVDASVNSGNSGGPLLDLKSGKVIGIITRKATGFLQDFGLMERMIKNNIAMLEDVKRGGIQALVVGVDVNEALRINQHQTLGICRNLARSANVGIGYAFSIKYVMNSFKNLADLSSHD